MVRSGGRASTRMTGLADLQEEAADARRAAAGDVGAFERLHRAHAVRIHVLARRFLGADDADDATQEVFIRAWQKLSTFRGEAAFGTWLHRLAVNVLIRRARAAQRDTLRHAPLSDELPRRETAPGAALEVEAALSRLEPGLRQVVVLSVMEGYSHDEIAEMLEISPAASRMRLHRARNALRAFLPRPGRNEGS